MAPKTTSKIGATASKHAADDSLADVEPAGKRARFVLRFFCLPRETNTCGVLTVFPAVLCCPLPPSYGLAVALRRIPGPPRSPR